MDSPCCRTRLTVAFDHEDCLPPLWWLDTCNHPTWRMSMVHRRTHIHQSPTLALDACAKGASGLAPTISHIEGDSFPSESHTHENPGSGGLNQGAGTCGANLAIAMDCSMQALNQSPLQHASMYFPPAESLGESWPFPYRVCHPQCFWTLRRNASSTKIIQISPSRTCILVVQHLIDHRITNRLLVHRMDNLGSSFIQYARLSKLSSDQHLTLEQSINHPGALTRLNPVCRPIFFK